MRADTPFWWDPCLPIIWTAEAQVHRTGSSRHNRVLLEPTGIPTLNSLTPSWGQRPLMPQQRRYNVPFGATTSLPLLLNVLPRRQAIGSHRGLLRTR